MTSLRRAAFVALVLLPGVFVLPSACSSGAEVHPPPPPEVDSGQRIGTQGPDSSVTDTGATEEPMVQDTSVPDISTGDVPVDAMPVPVVSPSSDVYFGSDEDGGAGPFVPCGTQATSQQVTISNTGNAPFTWMATVTSGATYYTLSPSMGMVPAGGSQPILVNPVPIPGISAVPGGYDGTLSIMTTPSAAVPPIKLHMSAYGAILTAMPNGSMPFGGVAIGQTAPQQLTINNTGNAPVTITLATGNTGFFTVSPLSEMVLPNIPASATVSFKPQNVQPYMDTLSITASGAQLCGAPLANTSLTGSGTTGVGVAPTNLNFGTVQCGSAAAMYQTTTITNSGGAITYTPTLTAGANSPYTLADNMGNTITSGNPIALGMASMATIRVVPKQILNPASTALDGYADTLTISTTSPMDSPHIVALHQTAQGAILSLQPPSIMTPASTMVSFTGYSVGNTGNLAAGYTLSVLDMIPCTLNLMMGTLGPNTTQNGVMTCTPPPIPDGGMMSSQLGAIHMQPDVGVVLCADPPPDTPVLVNN